MGKVPISQLGKMQELPSQIGIGKCNSRDRWGSRQGDYHRVDGVYPWKRVKRFLKANVGKKFSVVFHEYCQLVPVYQQKFFLKEFEENLRGYIWNRYYVDEDGLIQEHEPVNKYKGPYTFTSIDAVYERRHKITGKKEPEYTWHMKDYKRSDYETVLVKGWEKVFESKSDPEYKKLMTRKMQELKKRYRTKYRGPSINDEDFRKILKAKELKEKAEDLVKIIAHGFDPLTSFRKEKKQDEV